MSSEDQIDENSVLEEQVERQELVPFQGDELTAAMTVSGDIFVTLTGVWNAVGLSMRPQLRRILHSPPLAKGLRRISLNTRGGMQQVYCLRVDKVALWLAGVESSKVKAVYRAKIEAYQDELAPVAMRIFMHVMGIPATVLATTDPRLVILAEQYDELLTTATFIREHMDTISAMPGQLDHISGQLDQAVQLLESLAQQQETTTSAVIHLTEEQKLTPAQKQHIKDAVNRIADDSKGKPGELKHAQIYSALYQRFHVNSYANIQAARYDDVLVFLRDLWKHATTSTTPIQKSLF